MDIAFLKWLGEAYGPWVPLVVGFWWYGLRSKDEKPDVARELISKIDGIDSKVISVSERVARIEGKLDAD